MVLSYITFLSHKNILSVLIYLLPLALVIGSFLADSLIVIAALIFLIQSIKKKKWHYYTHPFMMIFWVWCLYLLIRSLLSNNIFLSLESSLFYWRFGLFALSIWYILDNNNNFIKYFSLSLLLTYIVVLFDGYFQYITGSNLLGQEYNGQRLSGLFGDEYILGSYLARLLPLLFAVIIYQYNRSIIFLIISMLLLVLTDVLIYISGERSAFFYLLLTTIIIISFSTKLKWIRLGVFIFSIIIIIYISITNTNIKFRMIDSTLIATNIGDKINIFSPVHQSIYKSAIKIFADNPIIGIGPKMFREACIEVVLKSRCQSHPHNTYIQLLTETGIIGFSIVFILFFFVCYQYIRQGLSLLLNKSSYLSDYQVCLYAAIMITLWPIIPTGNFFHNWLNVIYFFPVGFLLHSYDNK